MHEYVTHTYTDLQFLHVLSQFAHSAASWFERVMKALYP
jgi:hypothetical protein